MKIRSCGTKAHPKVVPKFTCDAAFDFAFIFVQMHGAATETSRPPSQLPLFARFWARNSSWLTGEEEEEETDSGGFLNIYSHYVLPYTWQAVAGMAANVGLINRWRV